MTRREALRRTGTGMGLLGLAALLGEVGELRAEEDNPLAAKPTHFPGKAKRVIHIYLNGGPSQVDTFDPKPMLARYAGRTIPTGNLTTERPTGGALAAGCCDPSRRGRAERSHLGGPLRGKRGPL